MQFAFIFARMDKFFDYRDGIRNGHAGHVDPYVDHVVTEAREWLEERVGPIDWSEINTRSKRVAENHWDVVHPRLISGGENMDACVYLAVRMDTDEVTAVEFKLRWG